jgi:HEAT repeat protein
MKSRHSIVTLAVAVMLAFPQSQHVRSQEVVPHSAFVAAAWDTLKDGLADNDVEHRKNAIAAIGTIGADPQAVKMVEHALQDKDPQVRQTAAATLGQMGDKDAIPALRAALDDTPEVTFTAAKALWQLGDTSGREIFQEVIEGERPNAPGKLHGAVKDAKKKLAPGQLTLMGVKDATGAVFGPASLGISAIEEAIKTAKKDTGAGGRSVAAEVLGSDSDAYALTLLEWALGDDNWGVRVSVAKALGERGNEGSIVKLEPLLKDDHHAVRYMAAASIVKLSLKRQPSSAD